MRLRHRSLLVIGAALGLVGLSSGVASAHVTVSAPGATVGGSDQLITFRVPNESGTASTIGLTVQLPTDTPIASVLVAPHTGWTDKVTTATLATPIKTDDGDITSAVSTITWTADSSADGIAPGQFDQFVLIAGQLPSVSSLTFKAIQRYSDKTVVSWVEVAAPGSPEPDHPAPTLTLAAATSPTSATTTTSATATSTSAYSPSDMVMSSAPSTTSGSANTALILSAVAVILATLGAALGLAAWRRSHL